MECVCMCVCVCVCVCVCYSVVSNSLQTYGLPIGLDIGDCQAPLSMWFSRQEYWSGSPFFSRWSSWLRDWTQASCIAGRFFTVWATRETWSLSLGSLLLALNSVLHSGFPCGSAGKESACNEGNLGSIPGLGRSPGEGKGYPLQYCGLENSMDCIVHEVTKSWTRLSDSHLLTSILQDSNSLTKKKFWDGMGKKLLED